MREVSLPGQQVKPVMIVATYTWDQCGTESYQPVSIGMRIRSEMEENVHVYSVSIDCYFTFQISSATFLPLVMCPSVVST